MKQKLDKLYLGNFTYNDFNLSMDNSHWILNIHDCADDDSVIIVDFNAKHSDSDANQMILKSKFMLEALLAGFFGFNAEDTEEALKQIEEERVK